MNRQRIQTPAFQAQVRRVFRKYNDLIQSHADIFTHDFQYHGTKMRKFSPLEFLGVGILLDLYPERPICMLADDIKMFREYLRSKLQDLRTNSSGWIHVMDYINRLENSRGYFPPKNETPRVKRQRVSNGFHALPKRVLHLIHLRPINKFILAKRVYITNCNDKQWLLDWFNNNKNNETRSKESHHLGEGVSPQSKWILEWDFISHLQNRVLVLRTLEVVINDDPIM